MIERTEKQTLPSEEMIERIRGMRLIEDMFFEVFAQNKNAVQEILRVIIGDDNLSVVRVITQDSERNLYGRSVRLDALCYLSDETLCNIEVQRYDNDDHRRRARYNGSIITVMESEPGEHFKDVRDVIIVFISEHDFFKGNKTIYHIDKVVRETGEPYDDGFKEIFVNAAVDDGSKVADLMSCFMTSEYNNPDFPETMAEIKRLKETEGGLGTMSALSETFREEGRVEGRVEGRTEGKLETVVKLVVAGMLTEKQAAGFLGLSVDEFRKKKAETEKKELVNMV